MTGMEPPRARARQYRTYASQAADRAAREQNAEVRSLCLSLAHAFTALAEEQSAPDAPAH
jgi:hypothetical protein